MKRDLAWFANKNCDSVEIKDYAQASDSDPKKTKSIKDSATITKLVSMIEKLPLEGEMMVEFSETVPLTVLKFHCGKTKQDIEFYGERIKTPATSFYMRSQKLESEVFAFVQNLLK